MSDEVLIIRYRSGRRVWLPRADALDTIVDKFHTIEEAACLERRLPL